MEPGGFDICSSGGGSEGHDLRRLKEVARFDLIHQKLVRMIYLKYLMYI